MVNVVVLDAERRPLQPPRHQDVAAALEAGLVAIPATRKRLPISGVDLVLQVEEQARNHQSNPVRLKEAEQRILPADEVDEQAVENPEQSRHILVRTDGPLRRHQHAKEDEGIPDQPGKRLLVDGPTVELLLREEDRPGIVVSDRKPCEGQRRRVERRRVAPKDLVVLLVGGGPPRARPPDPRAHHPGHNLVRRARGGQGPVRGVVEEHEGPDDGQAEQARREPARARQHEGEEGVEQPEGDQARAQGLQVVRPVLRAVPAHQQRGRLRWLRRAGRAALNLRHGSGAGGIANAMLLAGPREP
mmetsp:Transcript_41314/g.128766  ORF Transcript_41314/g.128766 Transcript_41314/m.128766 type:complete len:302 (-) Transcript_41314:14-919(-)